MQYLVCTHQCCSLGVVVVLSQLPTEHFKQAVTQLCSVQVTALTHQLNQLNGEASSTKTGKYSFILTFEARGKILERL